MNSRSQYAAALWAGRRTMLAATAGTAVMVAVVMLALPKFYIVRSVVDAGVLLPEVQPKELKLFVEAVDRGEFVVEGGRFGDSLTDSLTAAFRPPSSIEFEARSADPARAAQRLTVLTAGVLAELEKMRTAVTDPRTAPDARVVTLLREAAARARTLATVFEGRRASAVNLAGSAGDAAARAAEQRDALRAAAASRYGRLLQSAEIGGVPAPALAARELAGWLRADEPAPSVADVLEADHRTRPWIATLVPLNPGFSGLTAVSTELVSADLQLLSAVHARDAAHVLQQREERAVQALSAPLTDAAAAARMQEALDALTADYRSPSETGVVAQLREMSAVLASVAVADADAQAVLQRMVPHIVTPPAVPMAPAGPRPFVSLAITTLVALVGSALVVSIRGRK